jgi:hypothetical protein
MGLWKNIAQSIARPICCQNLCTIFTVQKSRPKIRAISVHKKLQKANSRPIDENSPNLITLLEIKACGRCVARRWAFESNLWKKMFSKKMFLNVLNVLRLLRKCNSG